MSSRDANLNGIRAGRASYPPLLEQLSDDTLAKGDDGSVRNCLPNVPSILHCCLHCPACGAQGMYVYVSGFFRSQCRRSSFFCARLPRDGPILIGYELGLLCSSDHPPKSSSGECRQEKLEQIRNNQHDSVEDKQFGGHDHELRFSSDSGNVCSIRSQHPRCEESYDIL
jgi:hypothetical protein